jgi:hypothetical protein
MPAATHYFRGNLRSTGRPVHFQFLQVLGTPVASVPRLQVETRPGVNGIAIWDTASRGRPFTLSTTVDTDTIAAAQALLVLYRELIGSSTPTQYFQFNVFYANVAVLDVREDETSPLGASSGGLSTSAGALLRAQWDLVVTT